MLTRIVALIVILATVYILLIFIAPNFADQYGDKAINAKIRNIKDQSLQFSSESDASGSLYDSVKNTAAPYIEDTKTAVRSIESSVNTKINQAQDAKVAVEVAYSGAVDASQKIKVLTGSGK